MKLFLLMTTLITVLVNCRVNANPSESRHPTKHKRKPSPKSSKANGLGPPISAEEIAVAMANSNLMKPHTGEDQVRENSGNFEGDIKLTPQQQAQMGIGGRSAVKEVTLLWEDAIIPYTISSVFTSAERSVIARAMAEFHERTCLKFVGRTTESDYIEIISGGSCWSFIGRIGERQELSLSQSGCVNVGTAIHEFMHASGFWHEQSRHDRDSYVTIKWENIRDSKKHNFNKQTVSSTTNLGLPYDYKSVMHYSATAFSKNGKPTITLKKAGETIGQRVRFSQFDVEGLNLLYNCGGCAEGFFMSGPTNQCFKLITHKEWRNWEETDNICREMGLVLPKPNDPLTLRAYIVYNYPGINHVWLNAKGDGTSFKWLSDGQEISNSDPLWRPMHWHDGVYPGQFVHSSDCLLLATVKWWADLYPDQTYVPLECEKSMYGVTLCEGCPEGFFMSGPTNQCFKLITHKKWRNWEETDTFCREMGLVLPKPEDPLALRTHIVNNYPDLGNNVWLNAKGDGESFKWQSGGQEISNSDPLWSPSVWSDMVYPGQFVDSSDCLQLITYKWWADQKPVQPYLPLECEKGTYGVTLCEHIN